MNQNNMNINNGTTTMSQSYTNRDGTQTQIIREISNGREKTIIKKIDRNGRLISTDIQENQNNNNQNNSNNEEHLVLQLDNGTEETITRNLQGGGIEKEIIRRDRNGNIISQTVNIFSGNNMMVNMNNMNNMNNLNNNINNMNNMNHNINNMMMNMNNMMMNMNSFNMMPRNNVLANINGFDFPLNLSAIMNVLEQGRDNPVDKNILNALPCYKIQDVSKLDVDNRNCLICMENFQNEEEILALPCAHLFHRECLIGWLEKQNTCPICKFEITYNNIQKEQNKVFRN
jgi:hypothetical protein